MTERSLSSWLTHLETLHPCDIDMGLARVAQVAKLMQLLPQVPVVTVGGTNGKGSTVAVLEGLALGAGLRCGVFSSPHFLRYNERVRIAGAEAEDEALCASFAAVDAGRGAVSLSYFEFSFLSALWLFQQAEVDVVILEVGLGGRLDAVNIVDADVAVITSIALDHQHWLGDTRELIAREKIGITRSGRPLVLAESDPPATMLATLAQNKVPCYRLNEAFSVCPERGYTLRIGNTERELPLKSAIPGLMPANIAAALQAYALLGFPLPAVFDGKTLLPQGVVGRRQCRAFKGREVIVDVAHNPAAVEALGQFLQETSTQGRTIALFNAMSDKDIRGMIRACKTQVDVWWVTGLPDVPRAASVASVVALLQEEGVSDIHIADDPSVALPCVVDSTNASDRLLVFGSFFTVATVLPLLT